MNTHRYLLSVLGLLVCMPAVSAEGSWRATKCEEATRQLALVNQRLSRPVPNWDKIKLERRRDELTLIRERFCVAPRTP